MKPHTRLIFALVMLCFLVSGMAGLIYQVVWSRYLALFLGHTSYAVVAVLVAFMGGLAVGNAWFGVKADHTRRPLALYAWIEIGIGIYALLFPLYYDLCHRAFVGVARSLGLESGGLLSLKFAFSFLTILVPTILMGATFPILTKFVTRALAELREKVAALYCINSVGAVLGCLVAGFWLIPEIGLEGTLYIGAAMNVVVGVIALMVSFRIQEGSVPVREREPEKESNLEQFTPRELRLAIIGIGVSGFVAMLYEVAWTRLLGLALGSSTHAFTLMLVTFITGIAIGAYVIYLWKSLRRTLEAFAWAELALAITLFASMFFYEFLPYWFVKLATLLARREEAYGLYQFAQALICFGVMLIPAMCLGTTLPLVTRIATAELARTGRSVGRVFALNTIGTVLGAVVTGLWLLPWLGLARTFAVGIALNALIGLVILLRHRPKIPWLIVSPVLVVAVVVVAGWHFNTTWQYAFTLGLWRAPNPPASIAEFRQIARSRKIDYYRDGAGATVNIESRQSAGKTHLSMKVNGKADASTGTDVATQLLSGHIPMLLRPESKRVLVVGMGSGMTGSAIARHPGIERVDMVEISPEVVEAAKSFSEHNDRVHENPRVRIIIEDAKSFLHINDNRYDAIVSEPSNPWMAGVSGVFSREYYESCSQRLSPGGLMVQWVQVYETNDEVFNMVLRTFTSVFPHISIWQPSGGDLVLIGSREAMRVDLPAMDKRFHEPAIRSDMERFDLTRFTVLLSRQLVPAENGMFVPPEEGPIHSDYFPSLEYKAQKAFFVRKGADQWRTFDENFSTRPTTLLGEHLKSNPPTEADYKAMGIYFMTHKLPPPGLLRSILVRWEKENPRTTTPMELAAQLPTMTLTAELEALRLAPTQASLMELAARDPEPLRMYESLLIQYYRTHRSAFYIPPMVELESVLQRLIETNPARQRIYKLHLAELAWDRGDDAACLRLGQSAFDPNPALGGPVDFSLDPKAPRWVLSRMAESFWRAGKAAEAWDICLQAKRSGFISDQPGADLILEMTFRKMQAYAGAVPGPIGR